MNIYLKYFLLFLVLLLIVLMIYFIVTLIIYLIKITKALDFTLINNKYCKKDRCDPTDQQLNQKLPTIIIDVNSWQLDVAKYCSIIIYSIEKAALIKANPVYPEELIAVKEVFDNKNDPVFGTIFTEKNTNSNNIWISFRGTQTNTEFKQDSLIKQESLFQKQSSLKQLRMNFLKSSSGETPSVHQGFVDVYMNFRNDLLSTLKTLDPDKTNTIIISGHSLGAAVATLVGLDLLQSGYTPTNVVVYAFASPRVGDNTFKNFVDDELKLPLYRLVNISDVVPNMPLSVSSNIDDSSNPYIYLHCGVLVPFQINRLSILNNHLMPTYMAGLETQLTPISPFPTQY